MEDLLLHLPAPTQHLNLDVATDAWAVVLEEAYRMGDLISILAVVREASGYRTRPDLVRAVKAYQQRCGLDMGAIAALADDYVSSLAKVRPRSWRTDADWIAGTAEATRSLRTLTKRFDELARWPIANEDIDQELQTIQHLLDHSRRLLEGLRQAKAPSRRQEHLGELRRLGRDLQAAMR